MSFLYILVYLTESSTSSAYYSRLLRYHFPAVKSGMTLALAFTMRETLTKAVMAYKKSGEGWDSLSDRICLYIYNYPGKWTDWDEDKCSDFFISFLPKIPGIVKRYQPEYRFEAYLSCSLRWYMKTFTENQAKKEHYECWAIEVSETEAIRKSETDTISSNFKDSPVNEPLMVNPEDCPFELEENGMLKDPALRRRLLYAVLLRVADVDDHRIPAIAALVDVDADWLYQRTIKARKLVLLKISRREKLRSRRNECWYNLDGARKRIESVYDSNRRNQWERKAHTWKKRYITACHGIRAMNIAPTHRDIGRMLDVPPGTVSSGLHLLRKRWHSMEHWTSGSTSG